MEQTNGYTAVRQPVGDEGGGINNSTNGRHRPLPPFNHVNFYLGDRLLFRKQLSSMAKPKISLKIGSSTAYSPNSPAVGTPTPGGGNKIRISLGGASKPSTPNEVVPPKITTKTGRASKPSAKLTASKKRAKEESDNESESITVNTDARAKKKIKFNLGGQTPKAPKTPIALKAKFKGKPPKRPLGEGYDSEASDREEDPVIEEEWILRMIPGDDCEYLRQMVNERKIGIPVRQGGADIYFKFFHAEGRRALVTIRGHHYAATMVDLPCVIEGMKSWDKKGWYKSADICQMLLVFARINNEHEAETIELPKMIDPNTFQYPHGLTAPMHDARKRRFRKRIRREAIEAVEDAVEKLLAADADAEETRYEFVTDSPSRQESYNSPNGYGEEYSENEEDDAPGEDEEDYFGEQNAMEEGMDDLEADLEAAFEQDALAAATPSSQAVADTPAVFNTEETSQMVEDEDSGDESLEDDDEEGDSEDEVDEDERARNAELQGAREDILEMERQLENLQTQYANSQNTILKSRIKLNIEKVKGELQLKKSAIGEGDDD